ncbi:MAG: SGNH/GDSL hydrolase family protein [Polynucleobacter sp.]|uniref:SGNH/GDSL hydrolase family protein n=1 Tax=Polynucleobacter sp. TaxID=2029855 RepID=UPI0027172D42|nr:SGNH/GDSL hydrolase family protein [Polynucleobacter sp.]MDO8714702.1 SGNH/GDSL hydrolase family protein [Polynucleobacter sp.]
MSLIKKIIFIILAWIISISILLVATEFCLRIIFNDGPWSEVEKINVLRNFEYKYRLNGLYPAGQQWVRYKRNAYGLRDDCGDPNNIDILTVGGSTTDQRYVLDESTYQFVLAGLLSQVTGKKICVTNAGVDGHSTYGHLEAFKNWFPLIPGMHPKYALLYVGLNDANFDRPNNFNPGFDANDQSSIKSFLKGQRIVRLLMPLYNYIKDGAANEGPAYAGHNPRKFIDSDYSVTLLNSETLKKSKVNAEIFGERLTLILGEISKMNAEPICVTQHYLYSINKDGINYGIPSVIGKDYSGLNYDYSLREINDLIYKLCGERVVDLYPLYHDPKYFYDGVHTTDKGSEFIGKNIFEITKKKGLLNNL